MSLASLQPQGHAVLKIKHEIQNLTAAVTTMVHTDEFPPKKRGLVDTSWISKILLKHLHIVTSSFTDGNKKLVAWPNYLQMSSNIKVLGHNVVPCWTQRAPGHYSE